MTEHETGYEKAARPDDLTRLFVGRANAKDADGIAALYEPGAVMAYPPGQQTTGRDAIREFWEKALPRMPHFEPEPPLPTLISVEGDIALTSTPPRDGAGARAQVARRQPDGTWLRLLDYPELGRLPDNRHRPFLSLTDQGDCPCASACPAALALRPDMPDLYRTPDRKLGMAFIETMFDRCYIGVVNV